MLGVSERTVHGWEAAKTVPNLAAYALECVAMLLAEQR
jgi:DNA-binding transcriptional regulator YiaG